MPTITINGEVKSFAAALTVAELLRQLGKDAKKLAVEVNRHLVPRTEHADCRLRKATRSKLLRSSAAGADRRRIRT